MSSNKWARVLLVSTGVLSMAIVLKLCIPVVLEFMVSQVPVFWTCLLSWLTPPYLYVIINGIIITIAASSRFHQNLHPQAEVPSSSSVPPVNKIHQQSDFVMPSGYDDDTMMMMMKVRSEFEGMISYDENHQVVMKNQINQVRMEFVAGYEQHHGVIEKIIPSSNQLVESEFGGYDHHEVVGVKNLEDLKIPKTKEANLKIPERKINRADDFSHDEKENSSSFVISASSWVPPNRTDSMDNNIYSSNEKPPASSRFNHKKSLLKPSPEGGKSLGVTTKPKRHHDTLESTWKTITDGRSMPLTRHLKKSDTWEARHHNTQQELTPKLMKKSETFNERHNNNNSLSPSPVSSPSGNNKLKKEASLSQDDLNRRVEAFINKFNQDMRLQRQESLNQYKEMVSPLSRR